MSNCKHEYIGFRCSKCGYVRTIVPLDSKDKKIKVVQIAGERFLDDKGRVWELLYYTNRGPEWEQLELPEEPTEE